MVCGLSDRTRNVIHVALGFVCVFFAFNSQGFIEQTVIDAASVSGAVNQKAGYYSLAIIYALSMAANLVVAPAVDFLGARLSMFFGCLMYTIFLIGFLFLNAPFLYISSALLGIGSAFLWTGQGKYLTLNTTKETAGRNSGLFWGLLQTSLVGGGCFLLVMFSVNASGTINTAMRNMLYGVFAGVCLVGNILLLVLPMKNLEEERPVDGEGEPSQLKILTSAFRLLVTPNMLLLSIVFIYTGIELSYWSGVFSTVISFTKALEYDTHKLMAYNAICQGIGQIIGGFLFGVMGDKMRKYGRNPIVAIGFVTHLICFILSFINFPPTANMHITHDSALISPSISLALIVGVLLGFGDACWNTQCYSILVDVYCKQSAQAFSIYKFFQSAAACAGFFYSGEIRLPYVLAILTVFLLLSFACFFYVEHSSQKAELEVENIEVETKLKDTE